MSITISYIIAAVAAYAAYFMCGLLWFCVGFFFGVKADRVMVGLGILSLFVLSNRVGDLIGWVLL